MRNRLFCSICVKRSRLVKQANPTFFLMYKKDGGHKFYVRHLLSISVSPGKLFKQKLTKLQPYISKKHSLRLVQDLFHLFFVPENKQYHCGEYGLDFVTLRSWGMMQFCILIPVSVCDGRGLKFYCFRIGVGSYLMTGGSH